MTGPRPLAITLRTGHVLSTTADSLHWTCAPTITRPLKGPVDLRDLVERIAREPGVDARYGQNLKDGAFGVVYAIIAEIREMHGTAFAWSVSVPDDSCMIILDELDDLCCESRAWLRGTTRDQIEALCRTHNARIGFQEPTASPEVQRSRLRTEIGERAIQLRSSDGTCIDLYVPRGEVTPRYVTLAGYLAALTLAQDGETTVSR